MSYTNVYPSRINWENEPNINTPINATNLNKMDYALYSIDGTLDNWDVTKADQSNLLLCVKSIDYDDETGEFLFTWQNGTTKTVDLNIEKIPVSFSMDANGVITMTTEDGTTYTADVGSLIKTYTFTDSSEIDFTTTTDASGNKTVTASIVAGSIDGTKLTPNYLANCQSAASAAGLSEDNARNSSYDSEAWAVGERNGVPVTSGDPTYHNNSKYWSDQAPTNALANLTDVDVTGVSNNDILVYKSLGAVWDAQPLSDYLSVWSSAVICSAGATYASIDDTRIQSDSIIEPFIDDGQGNAIPYTMSVPSYHNVWVYFDALPRSASVKVRITNL